MDNTTENPVGTAERAKRIEQFLRGTVAPRGTPIHPLTANLARLDDLILSAGDSAAVAGTTDALLECIVNSVEEIARSKAHHTLTENELEVAVEVARIQARLSLVIAMSKEQPGGDTLNRVYDALLAGKSTRQWDSVDRILADAIHNSGNCPNGLKRRLRHEIAQYQIERYASSERGNKRV